MQAPSSVPALIDALVHQSATATPATRRRHARFITTRLAISFGCLAVAPFFVAFRGAPTAIEILVFACSFAPLAAAVLAARTGHLVMAHAVAFMGLIVLSLGVGLGLGCGIGCAAAWLVAAQVEAASARDTRLVWAAGFVTGTSLLALLSIGAAPATTSAGPIAVCVFTALALAYVVVATSTRDAPSLPRRTRDDTVELWRTIGAVSDDLVMRFDASGSALAVVCGDEKLAAHAATSLLGRGIFDHVHIMDRPAFLKQISDAAHGTATGPIVVRLQTPDGTHRGFTLHARRLGAALPVEVVAILRDAPVSHADATEIASVPAPLDEAFQAKDHYLANVGHELRTPLNAIIGFSEMLASRTLCPADPEKQRDYARIIHQSGQHLLSVVNAILDVSKIRSGTFRLAIETFEIGPLVDLCCEMVALKAEASGVRLIRDIVVSDVVGDKRAYKQILINLLSNAVKFTPRGGSVTLAVAHDGEALTMQVADTGIGIAATDLARLGDPFFQAHADISRPAEGTGLGLSVVRGLVGLLDGNVTIDSTVGRGTCVTVRIPGQTAARQSRGPATIHAISPRTTSPIAAELAGRPEQRMKDIA